MEKIRLQKYLADAGVASRRKCEDLISAGRVSVNGETIIKPGTKVGLQDKVRLDGKPLRTSGPLLYIMLHKPEGVISSVFDPKNRPVVTDFVRDIPARLFPVGRLDYDTSGLILLTNDGSLAQKLTHPSYMVPKTYIAILQGLPSREGQEAFKTGLQIDTGTKTAPADFKILKKAPHGCTARITIYEGRNRQVRKMCEQIGCKVLQLKRISIGGLKLRDLARGQYRHLSKTELQGLL